MEEFLAIQSFFNIKNLKYYTLYNKSEKKTLSFAINVSIT